MSKIHEQASPMAGKVGIIRENTPELGGQKILIEDWWDKLTGKGWGESVGNMACMRYAMRLAAAHVHPDIPTIPDDNEVVYGKIGGLGYLVHVSEFEDSERFTK